MLRLAPSTAAAIDGILVVHLLISLSHDGLGQIVRLVHRGLHGADQHVSVISIVVDG